MSRMRYSTAAAGPWRNGRPERRARNRLRAGTMWLVKLGLTALLGLAGYLFVMELAAPALIDGIVGQHAATN